MKILLIDDSSFKRKALGYVIERHGHEVMEAVDGVEGLEKTRAYMPDIIVSDILMPRMDGFQFIRNIKKDEQLRAIPIIVYSTTYKEGKERELALSLGVVGFIEDVGKPEIFWQELQKMIEGRLCKEGKVCKPIIEDDSVFLREYAPIIQAKLEKKIRDLEEEVDKRRRAEEALRETEEKFSLAFHSSPVMLAIATLDGKHVEVNKAYTDFLGHTREEILDKSVVDLQLISEDERQKLLELARKGGGSVYNAEIEVSLLDGSSRHVLFSLDTISIGGVPHSLATLLDITGRRKVEEALRESEEKFRVTFNQAAVGIAHVAPDGRWLSVNQKICDIVGYTRDELMKRTFQDITYPDDLEADLEYVRQMLANKIQTYSMEKRYIRKDGSLIWINLTVSLVRNSFGEPQYFISVVEDISRRKKAEEELRLLYLLIQDISLAEDFSSALEVSLMKICETTGWVMGEAWLPSADSSHLECSPAWYGKSGLDSLKKFRKASEGFSFHPGIGIPGRAWSSKRPVWDTDVTLDLNFPRAAYAKEAGLKAGMAIPVLSGDQVVAVLDFFVMEMKEEDRRLVDLISTVATYLGSLFQRKKAEEEMRKLFYAVEQSPASVFITDAAFNIEYINPKFIEITGYSREEAIGMKPDILNSGTALISDSEWRGEFLAIKKNGDPFWEYATISPVRNDKGEITNFIGIHEDITERRKIEDQLRHSQKLEELGQLVGGIAHDFNNILTAIIGFAGMMQMKMSKDDPLMLNVEQILEAAERGATLTSSLLVFGRKQAIFPRPLDLNEVVKKVEKLLLRLIGEDIELRTVIADKELNVTADPLQLEQVLINLATNARDAMSKEGVFTIETGHEKIDRNFIHSHGYGEPGEYALISVSDTGAGMDEKTREKIFEPFFTTKEVGKGTGLGLAIVYGIVKQHNGYITVYSEVGKGTTFKIFLPMTWLVAVEATPVKEAVKPSYLATPATGTETVLIAEDDNNVRRLSKTLLETFGYTVIEAVNGEEAVQKYRENKDIIKLLVLDVIMPRKNGKDAYEEIKKITPGARVIFVSGYTADIIKKKGIIDDGMVFISKPILPTDFMKKVREVLDR